MCVLRGLLALCGGLAASSDPLVSASASSCHSHTGDALLGRVDAHLALCLPSRVHAKALEPFQDALVANEFDATQHRPLAVVAVSSSTSTLERFASAVATAVVGVSPAPHAVRVVDLLAASASTASNHELLQRLRSDMASTLRACPRRRTVFVVKHMECATGERLPLLDLFLDPMNGERATLHDTRSGQDLDCRRTMFVFLYRSTVGDVVGSAWREYFLAKWRAAAAATALKAADAEQHHMSKEAFTPQALAGRLTTAVELRADHYDNEAKASGEWAEVCELSGFLKRLELAQLEATPTRASVGLLGGAVFDLPAIFSFAMIFVAVLVYAKWFAIRNKQKSKTVRVVKNKNRKKQQLIESQAAQARLESLRSHSEPTSSDTESKSAIPPGSMGHSAKSPHQSSSDHDELTSSTSSLSVTIQSNGTTRTSTRSLDSASHEEPIGGATKKSQQSPNSAPETKRATRSSTRRKAYRK